MVRTTKTLPEQIDEYINGWCVLDGQRPTTLYSKRTLFNRILVFLAGRDLTLETAREFVLQHTQHGNTMNTIATEVRNLRTFVRWQERTGYTKCFTAEELALPKQTQREMEILPDKILAEIIDFGTEPRPFKPGKSGDHAGHRFAKGEARSALHFMRLHGTRIGETLDMKGKDLKLNEDIPSTWITRKGGKRVLLPLHRDFIEELRKRAKNDRLFKSNREICNLSIQRGAKMMGISEALVTHSLRHSFATNRNRGGMDISKISKLLGHSDILITDKMYTHLNITDLSNELNKNAVYGIPVQEKLDDLLRYTKDRFKGDPRFTIDKMGQSDDGKEIVLTIVVKARKALP